MGFTGARILGTAQRKEETKTGNRFLDRAKSEPTVSIYRISTRVVLEPHLIGS